MRKQLELVHRVPQTPTEQHLMDNWTTFMIKKGYGVQVHIDNGYKTARAVKVEKAAA